MKEHTLELPLSVISLIDVSRLQRELEAVTIFLSQASSREPGQQLALPRTTKNLEKLCQVLPGQLYLTVEDVQVGRTSTTPQVFHPPIVVGNKGG